MREYITFLCSSTPISNLHTQESTHIDTHTHVETSHGFTTARALTASTLLTDYINSPGLAQVYQYQSQRENTKTSEITYQICIHQKRGEDTILASGGRSRFY